MAQPLGRTSHHICAMAWDLSPRTHRMGHMERPAQADHHRSPPGTRAPTGSVCTTTKLQRWRPPTMLVCMATVHMGRRHQIRTLLHRDMAIARGTEKERPQLTAGEVVDRSGTGLRVAAAEVMPMEEVQAVDVAVAVAALRPGQLEIREGGGTMEEAMPVYLGPRVGAHVVSVVAMVADCAARPVVEPLKWY